ncbi:pyrroline-5-carboxylate reductase [Telmatospirillum siberiense]|uniref:Pyrroline-5-carboxylate reductase n=1 Tax=Telmatospirillum siberiense TaxID=382514 RepID=A0A2N3PU65_9PROT|nr:pyrroline-5-carboxylate reductase [Telmatospirillum siberiense]PKU23939.1 pyrroline-5-carboxylate reductase [Telmatospirillum siberiense]
MTQILLVGCGKMGGALLDGWLALGMAPRDIFVVDPEEAKHPSRAQVRVTGDVQSLPADLRPDVVVLAVKPQMMDAALPAYARFAGAVYLTIAAGKPLAYFARILGSGAAVVRAMPNTPASVRRGMTVAVANSVVAADQRKICGDLLAAVGAIAWIEDEAHMDAVTALSGSGPAYVFLLAEVMAAAGVRAGLPEDLAARLARETVVGAGELLRQSSESPEQLRRNVTSPGGTTFAALQVLMRDDGVGPLMGEAVAAATDRSRELAG